MRKPFARICFAQIFWTDFLHGFSARIFCTDFLHGFSCTDSFARIFARNFARFFVKIFARIFCTDFLGCPKPLAGKRQNFTEEKNP